MQNYDEKIVAHLLDATGSIIDKYDAIARETGESFNIFEIARIDEKEVIVCRVIAELLNPKGRHGQGGAFLKIFLVDCLGYHHYTDRDVKRAMINTEYPADGRRIDIAIKIGYEFIPIEVKIYAGDQPDQCYDYCKYARRYDNEAKVVYISLYGDLPVKESRKDLKDCDIIPISFSINILSWLKKCLALPETNRKTPVREILIQFISAIKKITNQLEDKIEMEMVQVLSSSEQTIRNAKAISDSLEACRKTMVTKFFDAIDKSFREHKKLERKKTEWDYDVKDGSAYVSYFFSHEADLNLSVVFYFCSDQYNKLHAGFGMMKDGSQKRFSNKSIIKTLKERYRISENGSLNGWAIDYNFININGEQIDVHDIGKSINTYFSLFDPVKFNEIVNSTVKQALAVFTRLKH